MHGAVGVSHTQPKSEIQNLAPPDTRDAQRPTLHPGNQRPSLSGRESPKYTESDRNGRSEIWEWVGRTTRSRSRK